MFKVIPKTIQFQRFLATSKEEYIKGVQGYAPGFSEPTIKQQYCKGLMEKQRKTKIKKEISLQRYEKEKEVEAEVVAIKPYSKFPQKRYRQQLTDMCNKYKVELKQKEKTREEARIKAQTKQEQEKKKIEETRNLKIQEYNKILESDQATFATFADDLFVEPIVDEAKKKEEILAKEKEERTMNRIKAYASRKEKRMELLLKLFYMAEDFVTPQNIDSKIEHAFNNQDDSLLSSSDLLSPNAITLNKRISMISDALNDTIGGKPGVKEIMEFHNKNN